MDRLTAAQRSENMRRIRSRDTEPEVAVRRYLHARGLRFRLYRKELPGCPDLVFPSRRVCVFVHGCFWHGCPLCRHGSRKVQSNAAYWERKIASNKARDAENLSRLAALGWRAVVFWSCRRKDATALESLAAAVLECPKGLRSAPARAISA